MLHLLIKFSMSPMFLSILKTAMSFKIVLSFLFQFYIIFVLYLYWSIVFF